MTLLSNFGKQGANLGLLTQKVDIEDKEFLSKYFVVAEYDSVLTAGRNPISFNGSSLLQPGSGIQVECIDSDGNSLYIEHGKSIDGQFSDVSKFVISIHIYDETYNGAAKLVLVGTTKKNEIVRWVGNITIDKTLSNKSKTRFYYKPTIEVRSLLYPVVDTQLAKVEEVAPPTPKQATARAYITAGSVTNIEITDGGIGYDNENPPNVDIYTTGPTPGGGGNSSGFGASATVGVSDGKVTSYLITSPGSGYTVAPTVWIDLPPIPESPELNRPINFSSSFHTYAANPVKDTNKLTVDSKRVDTDYRLVIEEGIVVDPVFPIEVFNSQMVGATIVLNITKIQIPLTYDIQDVNLSVSFTIKEVINDRTIILNNPFYYQVNNSKLITNILAGECRVFYEFIRYNTNPDSQLTTVVNGDELNVNESYAEITYRNLKTFSGFVARHKVYRRSLFYPGDFELISDDPLESPELLLDTVTFNKVYDQIGVFYHQSHVNKYYFTSSMALECVSQTSPVIDSMKIRSNGAYDDMDGSEYVIIKTDSIGVDADNIYYPYDSFQYNTLSGQSYNSNFISLKKDAPYILSVDVIMEKEKNNENAKVEFFFTSSIESIQNEKYFVSGKGLKLGTVSTKEKKETKYFSETQMMHFTPSEDYYGALTIIPFQCNVTLANLSLKIYGDYGFSPEIISTQIPFTINVANEAFEIKSELFDINSNLIFSDLKTTHTFDFDGSSLNTPDASGITQVINVNLSDPNNTYYQTIANNITLIGGVYIPNLQPSINPKRFVSWQFPDGSSESEAGKLSYTNVSDLLIVDGDYIELSTVDSLGVETTVKSLAIKYDGANNLGRRIYVDPDGVKTYWP
jgi:hypothetical protein